MKHTDTRLTYEMGQYSGRNWMIAAVTFATETGQETGYITADQVHIDEFEQGTPEADLRLWAASPALLNACKFGGGHMTGPDALEKVADLLEQHGADGWAVVMREKARRERAAIEKVGGSHE